MTAMNELSAHGPFRHEALMYVDQDAYVDRTTRMVRAALTADEPLLVALPTANLGLVRVALGAAAAHVRLVDMAEAGGNPNRIIPWVLRAFLDEHLSRHVRIICEPIWPSRAPEEVPLAIQHEALINRVFAERAATVVCLYDSELLDPAVLSFATRTHPAVTDGDQPRPCAAYTDPDVVVASLNMPLPDESTAAAELVFDAGRLRGVRRMVSAHAARAGLATTRIADLQLAVNEIATNTIVHGRGPGTLKIWQEHDRLICEIQGPGEIADWLAGRIVPGEDSLRGRGLLVANRLCDLVETYTHPLSTITRLHMRV